MTRNSISKLIYIITFFIAVALCVFIAVGSANASSSKAAKAYKYMYSINGYHESKNRKALQSRIGVNPRRVPWCGFVIKWAVKAAGGNPPSSAGRAKAWERFGTGVSKHKIRKGYVVTRYSQYAPSGRHVGMAGGKPKGGKVLVCSGNTKNRVRCVNWSFKINNKRKEMVMRVIKIIWLATACLLTGIWCAGFTNFLYITATATAGKGFGVGNFVAVALFYTVLSFVVYSIFYCSGRDK